jgi:hypothetical protein
MADVPVPVPPLVADGDELEPELGEPLLPQPASSRPAAAATAGSSEIRRIRGWNRMVSASFLSVILLAQ